MGRGNRAHTGTPAFHAARRNPGRFGATRRLPHPCTSGFTLLELMVAVSVSVILLALAIPSMQSMLSRNHLKAAAQSIAEDLQWARSEAIKRNRVIRVSIDTDQWCYGIDQNDASDCDCRLNAGETGACALKRQSGADFPGIRLAATFSGTSFEPYRATANNGSLTLTSTQGSRLRVVLSRLGRIRICAPSGPIAGYLSCSG